MFKVTTATFGFYTTGLLFWS